jgi:acyl-coenzyme A synthetase/AMP-(fatty) acid ligase
MSFDALLARGDERLEPADTTRDDVAFWLYSSGSTGAPKGTMHAHASLVTTGYLHGVPIVGVREDDVVFSAAKLFFAYGLGNALTYPMTVGATAILMAERPTPDAGVQAPRRARPTVFYGVPTLFAAMLASPRLPKRDAVALRIATSAGEALPEHIGRRFTEHFGVDVLDGIGSTEMLHVYLSNRAGDLRYGTSGRPVPGYELRIVDDDGAPVAAGEIGELQVKGPTGRDRLLEQPREVPRDVPGPVDEERRQVPRRSRRRTLRLFGTHRRHAEGRRHLRLAGRGRVRARRARGGPRGGGDRPPRCRRAGEADGVCRPEGGPAAQRRPGGRAAPAC